MSDTAVANENEEISTITKETPIEEKVVDEKPTEEKPIEEKTIEEQPGNEGRTTDQPEEATQHDASGTETADISTYDGSGKSLEENEALEDKQTRRKVRREKRDARLEAQDRLQVAEQGSRRRSKASIGSKYSQSTNASSPRFSKQLTFEDAPETEFDVKPDRSTMIFDVTYENVLIEAAMEEQSQSSESHISEDYCTVQFKDDFLQHFEDLPSFSELSLEVSDEYIPISSFIQDEIEEIEYKDQGVFVDPLTGEKETSSSESVSDTEEEIGEEVIEEHEVDDELVSIHSSHDFTGKDEDLEFDAFITFENAAAQDDEFQDVLETGAQVHARQMFQITNDFVNDLIKTVVVNAEVRSERVQLSKNIDKNKLYQALSEAATMFVNAKYANQELNKKVVEYFKRRRTYRSILPLAHDEELREQKRYESSQKYYDYLLKKEDDYKQLHNEQKADLAMKIAETKKLAIESEQRLYSTIRHPFLDRKFDDSRSKIENFLKIMHKKREHISAIRFTLIQRQHTMATLLEKLANLEKINSNLLMNTFVSTQTEVLALEKKIEERNTDLNKLRYTCNSELIMAAHLREKIDLFHRSINTKTKEHNNLFKLHREKREELYKFKIEHAHTRKLIMEKSFQGGLLEKRCLMLDFDATIAAVEAQQRKIKHMRESLLSISRKIDTAEELCASQRESVAYSQK